MKEYAVIFEKTSTGWSAYAPDLPGLGVAGPPTRRPKSLSATASRFILKDFSRWRVCPEPTTRVARMPISA